MYRFFAHSCLLILCIGFVTHTVYAQSDSDRVSITVAPTLIELGLNPGEMWRSSIKVINTNNFPLTVTATPAHFAAIGERGMSELTPIASVPENENVLARWITIEEPSVTVAPGGSVQIPFRIEAPTSASPGSHFAAIQVSTVPPLNTGQTSLQTAQVISSLIFLRVAGPVEEAASVRSFTATDSFGVDPATELTARIENHGNVHLKPVGEIVIRNMWGVERGRIPVNYNTSFGNVLPDSVREYRFHWRKDPSLFDIGYYTATLSLAYGVESRQFLKAKTGFWVIPVRPLAIMVSTIVLFVLGIFAISRWYVRRLLQQAGVHSLTTLQTATQRQTNYLQKKNEGAAELNLKRQSKAGVVSRKTLFNQCCQSIQTGIFLMVSWVCARWQQLSPKWRLVGLMGCILFIVCVGLLLSLNNDNSRYGDYEAQVGNGSEMITYNAEEITFFQHPGMSPALLATSSTYAITIVNESDRTGAAGALAAKIAGTFPVVSLQPGTRSNRADTAIIFPTELQAEALALNEVLGGVLLSAVTDEPGREITIYVGNDWSW